MKNNLFTLSVVFVSLLYCLSVSAQKVNIDLKYYIPENTSFEKGLSVAIANSKTEALRKAGLAENVSNYTTLITAETQDDFSEFFKDEILISINGAIKEWKHITPPQKGYDSELDEYFINLSIEAKVLKYQTKQDPSFVAKIEGLLPSYISGEDVPIDLKVKPYQNCYLRVFYISDSEAQVLYPIEVDIKTKQPNIFINKELQKDEYFELDYLYPETEKDNEFGKLIIIITKDNIPFVKSRMDEQGYYTKTSVEDIFEWILSIEPSGRKEYYEQFIISKN
tara:strand:- start:1484 stop:2323 length:840 start_codon:yes stop_codon:yes gene_type:complete